MNRSAYIFLILLLIGGTGVTAQGLQGLTENLTIKRYRSDHPIQLKSAAKVTALSLPFFEDFSYSSIFPDAAKWEDAYAFINNSFAVDPISLGVATLDAIDENGDVYALNDWPASSDVLTSNPIDLSSYSQPGDTVRLSFFYQAGGKGEVPEMKDSLLLEFYSPASGTWNLEWNATVDTATPFQQVILKVPGPYYQNGFRFRFRNYTSMSANDVLGGKGALSNVDCWNIDYIMMNTLPALDHEIIKDIALIEIPRGLLDLYESIPWLHLNEAQSITRNYMQYVFRNLEKNAIENLGRSYFTRYLNTGRTEDSEEFFDDFEAEDIIRRNDPFMTPFTREDESEEGAIEVGGFLITPEGQFKQNDTARTVLHFEDYYAYDDGTPEYGFGISGPSMAGALLAYRFRVYKPDTLRALDLFFNKTRDYFNENLGFQLCVWNEVGGKPGDLIYMSEDEFTPEFGPDLPDFRRYALNPDDDLIVTDTIIYVGLKQVSDEFLNIGYDVNRNNLARTFVNTAGEWFSPGSSLIPGSLMIRAVFGSRDVISGIEEIPLSPNDIILYPNPVSGILHINTGKITVTGISVFDLYGRLVKKVHENLDQIDVSGFPPGIYQVTVHTGEQSSVTRKVVVIQ